MERKLAAILSADAKGYSRLMGEDEVGTIRTLSAYREVMVSLIQLHRGRVVDMPGDNLLAEFASVVDAVQCAVEIQQALKARNAELPDHRRMEFRIGINLGDVVVDGERIYGDGVNIAARVEGLADAGGICISGTAYDQVKNKLALGYESLGEHAAKNIADPIRVYRVRIGSRIAPTAEAPPVELPDKPSIAVLPFVNMSGDPDQEYFSDGITEEIITSLSKISDLFVIARNSTFTYKGKPIKVQQVSQELGVRYVLEGSVRKAGGRVRITAQLVDATTGHHLWAERYDRDLTDIFALQDEITQKIMEALEVKLTVGEQARVWRRATRNPLAYERWLQGLQRFRLWSNESNVQARQMFEEAVALDAAYALAYAGLAGTYLMDVWFNWGSSPSHSMERTEELAKHALALDESYPDTYALLGNIHLLKRQHEEAIAQGERAIALNPNGADVTALLAVTLSYAGRHEEAITWFKKAIRLNPFAPTWCLHGLGLAYGRVGRPAEAIAVLKTALRRDPDFLPAHIALAANYARSGYGKEAAAEVAEVLRLNPRFSVQYWAQRLPYRNQADLDHALDGMRKAGLPE